MSLDTIAIARELRAASVAPEQAEAIASAIGRAVAEGSATKADLSASQSGLRADIGQLDAKIDALRASTKADIAQLDSKIDALRASTKADLAQLETRLDARIDGLRIATKADLADLRSTMLTWFVATQIGVGALIIAALRL
jgi:uncharacterized protein YlxW (UPF0749 family)